jgi:hypothetical protein
MTASSNARDQLDKQHTMVRAHIQRAINGIKVAGAPRYVTCVGKEKVSGLATDRFIGNGTWLVDKQR